MNPLPSPVIDAHAHVGTFGSWAQVSSTAESLLSEMDEFKIEKTILFAPDNQLVRETVNKYPKRFVGYVWPNPYDPNAIPLVKQALGEWGFRGIKLHPLFNAFLPNDQIVYPIIEEAKKARVPVAIHSGHPPFSLPWSIGELAEVYPDARIVMLHMGHGHGIYIQAAINTAKRYDNIILETSGMPMHTKIREAVRTVGERRVVYGSDIPFHHTSVELQRVNMAGLTEDELRLVVHDNAQALLI
jgi:predicted TIM-barrel fold metal-dependent hydrolase